MLRLLTCDAGHFWESGEDRCPQCGAPADSLPVLEPDAPRPDAPVAPGGPELLDTGGLPAVYGYEILEDLGRGPTGVRLYKAKQRAVGRVVLLELVLAKEDPSQHAWSSLRSQAAALARLAHPGVMQLWEVGERDRHLFYNACEYVEGPTLTQKVASKPLPPAQAVRLVEMLARTIDHAHAAGVLHRNLRPDAIRLQPTQMPLKLPDRENQPGAAVLLHAAAFLPRIDGFGLVRRPVEGETADAELYGDQAGFLSPEQAWGRVSDLGNATDVWGLGAILFFLLSGEPPYQGDGPAAVLEAIQTGEPGWRKMRRGGDDLEGIVRKAMARTPSRRYRSAGAMADDLRRLLLSLPLSIREPTPGYTFGKWVRRRPATATLLAVAALAAAGTLGGYAAGYYSNAATAAEVATLRGQVNALNAQLSHAGMQLDDLRRQAHFGSYVRELAQARQHLAAGQPLAARSLLNRADPASRGFEWALLHEQTFGLGKVDLPTYPGGIRAAAVDPAGRTVVMATRQPGQEEADRVIVWHVPSRNQTLTLEGFIGTIHVLAVSPSGDAVAAVGGPNGNLGGSLRLWHLSDSARRGQEHFTKVIGRTPLTAAAFSPDGQRLAVASDGASPVKAFRLADGNEVQPSNLTLQQIMMRAMQETRVARDGGRPMLGWRDADHVVRGAAGSATLWVSNLVGPAGPTQLPLGRSGLTALASCDTTGAVAGGLKDRTVRLLPAAGPPTDIGPLPAVASRLAFSPDGGRLAAAHADKVTVFARNGEEWVEVLSFDADGSAGLTFTAGGQALLTAGPKSAALWGRVGAR